MIISVLNPGSLVTKLIQIIIYSYNFLNINESYKEFINLVVWEVIETTYGLDTKYGIKSITYE